MECSASPITRDAQRDVVRHFAALQLLPDLFELLMALR